MFYLLPWYLITQFIKSDADYKAKDLKNVRKRTRKGKKGNLQEYYLGWRSHDLTIFLKIPADLPWVKASKLILGQSESGNPENGAKPSHYHNPPATINLRVRRELKDHLGLNFLTVEQ